MARNCIFIPHECEAELEPYSDEQVGRMIRALLHYSITGIKTPLDSPEKYLMPRLYHQEDRFQAHYEQLTQKRSDAGKKGAYARWGDLNGNATNANGNSGSNGNNTNTNNKTNSKTDTNTHKSVCG